MDGRSTRSTDLALLGVAVAWGSSYLAAKDVVASDGVLGFLTVRLALATTALGIVVAPRLRCIRRAEVFLGVLFGAILSVVFTLETFGVTMTSASNAGLIISLTIVMTPVLERCRGRTRLSGTFYAAALVCVVGVGLLGHDGGFAAPRAGDLLILLAAGARAVHVTVIAHFTEGRSLDTARLTFVQLGTGVVVFAVLSPLGGRGVHDVVVGMDARAWVLTIYLALVCTVAAFLVQIWAVRRTSASRTSLLLGTEPLWAVACGVLVGGEALGGVGVVGALLVLLGTTWGRRIDSSRREGWRVHRESAARSRGVGEAVGTCEEGLGRGVGLGA